MVFQKSNPFPKSIYENVAYGPRVAGERDRARLDDLVERCLKQAALWDEVKDRLARQRAGTVRRAAAAAVHRPGAGDRPGSAADGRAGQRLDPKSTQAIEDLIAELKRQLHDRHRHAQHAAGGPRVRPDRVLLRGPADRGRPDRADLPPARARSRPKTTSPAGSDKGFASSRAPRIVRQSDRPHPIPVTCLPQPRIWGVRRA